VLPGPIKCPVNPPRAQVVVTGMGTELRTGANVRQLASSQRQGLALRILGTGLLWATAGLHLDLYLTGYRTIPTIGWLFLLQVIAGFGLGALVLATGSRLAAAAGAGFALSTLGGYLLSVQFGLFGFREVRTTAGIVAGILEIAAFAVLAVYAALDGVPSLRGRTPAVPARLAWLGVAGASVVALALTAGAVAGAGGAGAGAQSASGGLRTEQIGGVAVLANSAGRTLYWFAPDTSSMSACNGSCAVYWPPVTGPVKAGPGVTGTLGTIRRADGSTQATYNGHPLYTYVGDSGAGQAHGNNLNLNGGLWHEVPASG
jgi:predicted lipoprotein with Yx(FWY)xxD motif